MRASTTPYVKNWSRLASRSSRPLRTAISEEGHGDVFLSRAKALLDHLGTGEVRSGFADWIGSEDHHVAEALMLLDRYIDPTRSVQELKETVDRVRQDIWLELNDDMTA